MRHPCLKSFGLPLNAHLIIHSSIPLIPSFRYYVYILYIYGRTNHFAYLSIQTETQLPHLQ